MPKPANLSALQGALLSTVDQSSWPSAQILGWAPGMYCCTCSECGARYLGDKRSVMCYPCADALSKKVTPVIPRTDPDKGMVSE